MSYKAVNHVLGPTWGQWSPTTGEIGPVGIEGVDRSLDPDFLKWDRGAWCGTGSGVSGTSPQAPDNRVLWGQQNRGRRHGRRRSTATGNEGTRLMSYNGIGSYYPISGVGRLNGLGQMWAGLSGTTTFDVNAIWTDWKAGAAGDNAAGARASLAIQAALNQLAYNVPVGMDSYGGKAVSWGDKSMAALSAFQTAKGLTPQQKGWPDQQTLQALKGALDSGTAIGPGDSKGYCLENGSWVPCAKGGFAAAGMGTGTKLAIAAVAAVGLIALAKYAKKKRTGSYASSY